MRSSSLLALALLALSHSASGATLFAANQGVDSGTCGGVKTPCRSISQTIANAVDGDTIVVGPGHYGDLNGDDDFADPGEEAAEIGTGCDCAVKIDKRVTVKSRDGAAATVIDGDGQVVSTVSLVGAGATGASFGATQAGFTVRGGQGAGVFVEIDALNARVTGNLAEGNAGDGFIVVGNGARVTSNRAIGNAGNGIQLSGDDQLATDDVANGNTMSGFLVLFGAGVQVQKCVASGNVAAGFTATLADAAFRSVAAVGNGADGLFFDGATGSVTLSSFAGNARIAGTNCGVTNNSGQTLATTSVYWGAATGPGADPADLACVSGAGSVLTTTPFKTGEIKIRPKPLR
jgi:hypothetical protein